MVTERQFFLRLRILLIFEIVTYIPICLILLVLGGIIRPERLLKMQSSIRKRFVFSKMGYPLTRRYYLEYADLRLSKRLRSRDLK